MENKKREYLAPKVEVKRVELESSICDGSSDIQATSPGASTTSQKINDSFGNDYGGGTDWDSVNN